MHMHIFFNSPYGNMHNLHKVLPSSSSRRVRNSAESKDAYVPSYDDNKNTFKPMKKLGNLCHTTKTAISKTRNSGTPEYWNTEH